MTDFSILRVIQAVVGLALISEYVRKIIISRQRRTEWHRVDRFLLLTGGVILLILGVWGKLPRII